MLIEIHHFLILIFYCTYLWLPEENRFIYVVSYAGIYANAIAEGSEAWGLDKPNSNLSSGPLVAI